jgi:hypothetical protein
MGVAVIIGLAVCVIALLIINSQLNKQNKTYEQELMNKARKGKK